MHAATLHLLPILAAEKSKVPFYFVGGALVVWALIVSMLIGVRRPDFPDNLGGERLVIAVTAVLVLATAATGVAVSGGAPGPTATAAPALPGEAPPAGAAPAAEAPPAASSSATATTGTPAPASSPAHAPAGPLQLAANPEGQLAYDTKQLSAKAGKVTLDFANASPLEHNVVIAQGSKVFGQTPIKKGPATLSLKLPPGTYTFYCAVPGHRQAGMEGTLTVS